MNQEMRIAFTNVRNAEKKFLPVLLEDLEQDEFPGYLRDLVYTDFRHQSDAQAEKIVEQIRRAVERFGQV